MISSIRKSKREGRERFQTKVDTILQFYLEKAKKFSVWKPLGKSFNTFNNKFLNCKVTYEAKVILNKSRGELFYET